MELEDMRNILILGLMLISLVTIAWAKYQEAETKRLQNENEKLRNENEKLKQYKENSGPRKDFIEEKWEEITNG
jgi:cell division protein FtsB